MFPCDSLRLQGLSPDVAKKSDRSAGALDADNTEGLLAGLFAEENEFDRRALWRIGSWGVVAVATVVVAVYANQATLRLRGDQMAADDFARQAQQIRQLARESQVESRKLASAVDTLNGDRDRLYSRVTVLEQGLDSVTGAIAKQAAAAKPVVASSAPDAQPAAAAQPAPVVSPVATAPAASAPAAAPPEKPRAEAAKPEPQVTVTSTVPAPPAPAATQSSPATVTKAMMGPPDPAAPKLIEAPKPAAVAAPPAPSASPKPDMLASIPAEEPKDEAAEEAQTNVQRTEFAVDLGTANSVGGLRALWRGVVASNVALKALTPIILVRENKSGIGMQLRLAAGPLQDAATAAKICAALTQTRRGCETTVYDGQRLALAAGGIQSSPTAKPDATEVKPAPAKRTWTRHTKEEPPPESKPSGISSWFSKKP
jgi:hypothetical protein